MRIVIDWAHREHFPVALYQVGRRGRVITMSGFGDNLRILPAIRRDDHVICFCVGDYDIATFESTRRLLSLFDLAPERVSILCNTLEQVGWAQHAGLSAYYCSKNAFIDENTFRPLPMQKRFDAVSNARLVKQKRVPLARLVGNLALLRGHELEHTEYDAIDEIPHAYVNSRRLGAREVARVLNASRVGLALSAAEGACQASSEYLLCGLPVVSTPSRGGRDVFYDSHNALIVEPRAEAVRDAVQQQIRRVESGEIDGTRIRLRHLELAEQHRDRFVALLGRAFDDTGCDDDPHEQLRLTLATCSVTPRYRLYGDVLAELTAVASTKQPNP